jgi:hypothetical protein
VAALAVSGCTSNDTALQIGPPTSPPPTVAPTSPPTTTAEFGADVALIGDLYARQQQLVSSLSGSTSGTWTPEDLKAENAFDIANTHPDLVAAYGASKIADCTAKTAATFAASGPADRASYFSRFIPTMSTLQLTPGWTRGIPGGVNVTPGGRVYSVSLKVELPDKTSTTSLAHVGVVDGKAYYFVGIGEC